MADSDWPLGGIKSYMPATPTPDTRFPEILSHKTWFYENGSDEWTSGSSNDAWYQTKDDTDILQHVTDTHYESQEKVRILELGPGYVDMSWRQDSF